MMARRSGAERVYACEVSDAMVRLSYEALAANELADSVTVLHSLSTMLSIPKNIPNRYYSISNSLNYSQALFLNQMILKFGT